VVYKMSESKFIGIHLETVSGTPPVNLKVNNISFLSVDPLVSNTAAYNLLERRALLVTSESSKPMQVIGGEPSTNIGGNKIFGHSVTGNVMTPTSLWIRAEFRSAIWAAPTKVRVMVVQGNVGDAPTNGTLWRNLMHNSFLYEINYPCFKLIAQKDFTIGGVKLACNKNMDEHKPGGTYENESTGTY
jgi:hypothetical protein